MTFFASSSAASPQETPARVALVTGASQGLGLALTRELACRGWVVAMAARHEERLLAAVAQLEQERPGARLLARRADVSVEADRSALVDEVARRWGRLDLLVHNASALGPVPLPSLLEVPVEAFEPVFRTNVLAPVRLVQLAWPLLEAAPRALVVSVTSDAALEGYPGWGVYGASKAALELVTRTLAHELAGRSVRFVAVDPGDMDTAMHRAAVPDADPSALADPRRVARKMADLAESLLDPSARPPGPSVPLRVTLGG
ncbi:MAG: SDR family oxidoreductase [Limnochordaceae bacterium]|nr:SDR family oxidoreductase [Limnochordaceae bacterium]